MGIVGAAQELNLNQVTQQQVLSAAQQLGDGKGAHRRDKHHGDAGEHAGQAQGKDHLPKHLIAVGAQVLGRLDQVMVNLPQH